MNTDLGALLGRIHAATGAAYLIATDGFDYHPGNELDDLAAALGYSTTHTPSGGGYATVFVTDPDQARWRINYRHQVRLRILTRAGADPADIAVLRDKLGVDAGDDSLAEQIDAYNEQARQRWLDEAARQRAAEIVNAREDERRKVLEEIRAASGDV